MIQLATIADAQPGDELHHPIAHSPRRIIALDPAVIVEGPPHTWYVVAMTATQWEARGWTAHTHGGQGQLFEGREEAGRA